ncbi:MAG: nucleotide exchange factor GrpE, partial [Pseudomonadota bacterium]
MQPDNPELNQPDPGAQPPAEGEQQPAQTAEAAPQTGQQAEAERTPSLEELLRRAELLAAEHHDAWLRAKAETENVRRRAQ